MMEDLSDSRALDSAGPNARDKLVGRRNSYVLLVVFCDVHEKKCESNLMTIVTAVATHHTTYTEGTQGIQGRIWQLSRAH